MFKKLLLVLSAAVIYTNARSQVTMTPQIPPSGVLLKSQLWNMLLVNTGNESLQLKISLSLAESMTGQVAFTAVTNPITLNNGVRQLQYSDVAPVQYDYSPDFYNMDRDPNGFVPAGNYNVCYSVISITAKGDQVVAEECLSLNVEPLSPPLLNTPQDEAVLETYYPLFTWLPPTPLNIFNDLGYDLIITEVLNGQSSLDAIQKNRPVYSIGFQQTLFAAYPASAQPLDTGKLYAWQVIARNNGAFVAQTEVWTFSISIPAPIKILPPDVERYLKLKKEMDAGQSVYFDDVLFQYENTASDTTLSYKISSIGEQSNVMVMEGLLPLEEGYNYLKISPANDKELVENQPYILEVFNSRNETWNLKFLYRKTNANQ